VYTGGARSVQVSQSIKVSEHGEAAQITTERGRKCGRSPTQTGEKVAFEGGINPRGAAGRGL